MATGDKGEVFILFVLYLLSPCSARLPAPCAVNRYIFGQKNPPAFPPKDYAWCMLIFFPIKMKLPYLDQTQKRCVSEIGFRQNSLEVGNQLINAGRRTQSISIQLSCTLDNQKCPPD